MGLRKLRPLALSLLLTAPAGAVEGAGRPVNHITQVKVTPASFLPSLGEKIQITAALTTGGRLRAEVLDRDGFVVRTLASDKTVAKGPVALTWDGRDDSGNVVPDEAYSFRLDLKTGKTRSLYFPANQNVDMYEVPPAYYSRADAALVYELPKASRVHLQAGQAALDPATGKTVGPVLKTIVNRGPRPAGRVLDHWNGRDETGTVLVSELPHFVVSIACWPLPENSVIATGNRDVRFLDHAISRKGTSRITTRPGHGHHHEGLTTVEDYSPAATVLVRNGTRTGENGCWQVAGSSASLAVGVTGPTAQVFRRQPAHVLVYEGVRRIGQYPGHPAGVDAVIDLGGPLTARRTFAVNWASDLGPTAPGVFCLEPRVIAAVSEERGQS
ncbi:MAG: hypothetical protein HY900_02670 [Deltaproteobacteria bacterium]|nr:hypothetical protein [Deltaproteobacteria bacterium]